MKTKVIITNMRISCVLGVSDKERSKPQEILVTLELITDVKRASKTDNITDTLNYREVYNKISELITSSKFHLLETLGKQVLDCCLEYSQVKKVKVSITKPKKLENTDGVTVEMEEEKNE